MWFCKLQSVLHIQHENKVLNPGLIVQRIAIELVICLYRLQNHRVGSKIPEFHGIILSHYKVKTQNLVALAVEVSISICRHEHGLHFLLNISPTYM